MIDSFSTQRLRLVATTVAHLDAELQSPENLAQLLNAEVTPEWPPGEYDRSAQQYLKERLMEGGASVVGWFGWYALLMGDNNRRSRLIGAAGFFGPPSEEGELEIGYSVIPSSRKKGYATEIVKALLYKAFEDPRVKRVTARTNIHNKASAAVLKNAGFSCIASDTAGENLLYVITNLNFNYIHEIYPTGS